MSRCAVIVAFLAMAAAFAQPPLTSDSSKARTLPPLPNPGIYPGRAALYVPPVIDVMVVLQTNLVPLVVQETVTSNVMQSVRWYDNGVLRTNITVLSSNIVSCTTNTVVK